MYSRTQTKRLARLAFPMLAALFFSTAAHSTTLFAVQGSVRQFFIISAPPGARAYLFSPKNGTVQTGITDQLGGLVFRNVEPGDGYIAAVRYQGQFTFSDPTTVLSETYVPPQSFYDEQHLPTGTYGHSGYGYIIARDGTRLSVQVQLPDGDPPFPTLIEYSGYSPSDPTPDDLFHLQVQPFRLIAGLLNYAYVGVNIRGTGCSGGDFDYFELLQSLDGYDVVETVAAQPWAAGVGMFGISYAGISQLFVAQTRPPHLAAISPLSPIDDTFRGTLYPGGIFNDGFALSWAMERQDQNRWPDPIGADWVVDRIFVEQDAQCLTNQLLRQQNPDLLAKIERNPFYPAVGNPDYPQGGDILSPYHFVRQITVPTYIAGAWQDDQTGGHWPVMLDQFDCSTYVRVSANNGAHADALGPYPVRALGEFLDLYVAHRVPSIPPVARFFANQLYTAIFGAQGVQVPPDRFTNYTYEQARAAFESENRINIYWESGARPGAQTPGSPEPAAESSYSQWPPAETQALRLFFQPEGGLSLAPPDVDDEDPRGFDSYVYDPAAKPRGDFRCPSGEEDPNKCRDAIWQANAVYDWRPLPAGKALAFVSDPLPSQLTMLGSGSVDLWLQSTALDTDVEVTLTEVRPDGQERYVQNGWLRASHRRLDEERSTELRPRHTHLQVDAQALPPGQFVPLRVELLPFAHAFRPESRLRISVETPGGNRPLWTFNVIPPGKDTVNWIAHSRNRRSSVVLPLVPNVTVPSQYPACPTSLRSQPCRDYVPGAPGR